MKIRFKNLSIIRQILKYLNYLTTLQFYLIYNYNSQRNTTPEHQPWIIINQYNNTIATMHGSCIILQRIFLQIHSSIQGSVNTGQKLCGEVEARRNKLLDSAQEEE